MEPTPSFIKMSLYRVSEKVPLLSLVIKFTITCIFLPVQGVKLLSFQYGFQMVILLLFEVLLFN